MKKIVIMLTFVACTGMQAQVAVWNMKSLDTAKANKEPEIAMLIRDADKKLTQQLTTVVDKEMTPSSGDKHDYMSMGRYWWPDPIKADGLPYIRKDGVSNPEIEKLDRYPLGAFAKSIETLSLAYYVTGNEKYAQKAVDNLKIWFVNPDTRMNPNMNYGQTIPGIRNGLGRGEGVLDTYSFLEMLDGVELLKKSKSFLINDQEAVKQWFTAYVNWLLTAPVAKEEQEAKNNHGTAFDVQLARYALFIGNEDLTRKIVSDFPQNRLFSQIQPDGSQPLELERTTALGYSTFNLTHFLDMTKIGKVMGIDLLQAKSQDGRSIQKAIDFLIPFLNMSVSSFPYKQIKDWDEVREKLLWQMYRLDKMVEKPLYKEVYQKKLKKSKKDIGILLF
ncbi:hypothetical protein FFWV33_10595 [Flavobacterium faecale]|uniref:Alginate lyase domain-containing protein n=1 Tax=Flavobacterium faecale TaxID=1355330 RepID=A0A2S1LE35_9FLAO|nr:alginate lyase family protein [Flavobacterium faecale]AWG21941.1 hypothetical protein FFWV33_10595 [Flavobacterium faecale]